MTRLLGLFLNNLLPILLAAGAGYLLARRLQIKPQPLSQAAFYVFAPCLIYTILVHSQLSSNDIFSMVGFTTVIMAGMAGLALMGGWLLHLNRRVLAAVLLATMFVNAGNYGLPVIQLAFGETALAHASVFFTTNSVLMYTLGVFIASLGKTAPLQSLAALVRVPAVYALAMALLMMRTGWQLPEPVDRTVTLLGQAAIPTILILLGVQLSRLHREEAGDELSAENAADSGGKKLAWAPMLLVTVIRLVASPLLALGIAPVFHLQGASLQAGVIEAGMPGAVLATVLATEYDVEPSFVTATVLFSTMVSPVTLTLLLAYLGG